jgi:hypothetical protein
MAQTMILYPKISFCATTIQWTYGGILHIYVGAVAGCSFYVGWGDGKQNLFTGQGEAISLSHDYFPNSKTCIPEGGLSFHVEIVGNGENCRITELGFFNNDMLINQLDLKHCVELEALSCPCPIKDEPITLDLSKNTALRYLDYRNFAKLRELNLSNNVNLIELYCQHNNIKVLNLLNNIKLRVLYCMDNGMNVLLICYGSQLKEVSFMEGNHIDAYTENEIMEIIESNPPVEENELLK